MGNELIGILMAAGGTGGRRVFENQVAELQTMSVEERTKYIVVKGLDESYRNKTFREVAECIVKDGDAFEPEQKILADKVKSFFKRHNPPDFICYFRAYGVDGYGASTGLMNNYGQLEIGMDEKIAPYITARQHDGREYDCIDMMAVAAQRICCGG